HAKTITITRGREHGEHYLSIRDDGDGVPRDEAGRPNFKYVATHIGDSIKRRLKAEGSGNGIQGEFGIGLLSFWTVGDTLTMISTGSDQRSYQMTMSKGDPGYAVSPRRDPSHRGPRLTARARARTMVLAASAGARRCAVPQPHARHAQRHHSRRALRRPVGGHPGARSAPAGADRGTGAGGGRTGEPAV